MLTFAIFLRINFFMSMNLPPYRIFVGSQKTLGGKGIYSFHLDGNGKPLELSLVFEMETPSFLVLHPTEKYLFALSKISASEPTQGEILSFKVGHKLDLINRHNTGGAGPCYISLSINAKSLFVANYYDGKVSSLPISTDGSLGKANAVLQHEGSGPDSNRQAGPHAHSIKSDAAGNFALACDLGADKIFIHPIEKETGRLLPSVAEGQASQRGAGPRHFVFDSNNRHIYVANELNSTVAVYSYHATKIELLCIDSVSSIPQNFVEANTLSEIVLHPTEKWLYAGNRGLDSIAVFAIEAGGNKISLIAQVPCGGKIPRHFQVDPTGKILLTANQNSGNVGIFLIDLKTGIPKATGDSVSVPGASCIVYGRV